MTMQTQLRIVVFVRKRRQTGRRVKVLPEREYH
jgi:hypothetical protein